MAKHKTAKQNNYDDKICQRCGRSFSWRAKWRHRWEMVKYCSSACRKKPLNTVDEAIERSIMALLGQRAHGATLCPAEAARQVWPANLALTAQKMEQTRKAARRLVDQKKIEIVQGGQVVDPSRAKGPIRLRLCSSTS